MNDEHTPDSPVQPEPTPDHRPGFWPELESQMRVGTAEQNQTAELSRVESQTEQLPRVAPQPGAVVALPDRQRTRRSVWPMAAAAAVLVVLGLGFVALRNGSNSTSQTELVVAPDETVVAPAAGGDGEGNDDQASEQPTAAPDGENGESAPQEGNGSTVTPAQPDTNESSSTNPEPDPAPPIPDFEPARGAVGEPDYLPLDQGVPADGTFLANWPERALTWYAVADPTVACTSPSHSEIRYVNGSGITQPVRDPQLRFSGEISHFAVSTEQERSAWVVACGNQLELFVATVAPTGQILEPTLVWLGEGSTSSALVLWNDTSVSLNAIEPGGALFAVEYDVETKLLSRNDGPSRIMLEAGAPAERSLTPLAATPNGGLTYWQGTAPAGTDSACAELFGSGQSDSIWLRQGEGQWQPAVTDDFAIGTVTAGALDTTSLQFAFADVCAGESGRVVLGSQLDDGRIVPTAEIDLAPFVPGYAAQLFWVDAKTLRIETDNSEFGFGQVRFDYRIDEGLIVQLD